MNNKNNLAYVAHDRLCRQTAEGLATHPFVQGLVQLEIPSIV